MAQTNVNESQSTSFISRYFVVSNQLVNFALVFFQYTKQKTVVRFGSGPGADVSRKSAHVRRRWRTAYSLIQRRRAESAIDPNRFAEFRADLVQEHPKGMQVFNGIPIRDVGDGLCCVD